MSIPALLLSAGASIGVGAVAAPALASVLSKPMTGQVVPTRITDLAGYLTAGGGTARGLDPTGVEDFGSQQSIGTVDNPTGIEDFGAQQSVETGAVTSPASQSPTSAAPRASAPVANGPATADQKRLLAVASFAGALLLSAGTFFLIRRVMA